MSNTNFQELNLSDRFLFPAALEDPITCRLILECIVEEEIGELAIRTEYTRAYNSEFKCIRLDVYAKDVVTEVSYNLEMQNNNEYNLPLRSRYYQAQIDVGSLEPGDKYTDLKPLYVIFICNFDPFGENLYRYTFSMQCEERDVPLNDGVKRIFFSTKGKNKDEVPAILIDFLGYLNDSTDTYVEQNSNEKVKEIHERIKVLKKNRAVEDRYMHYLYVDKIIEEQENALKRMEEELEKNEEVLEKKKKALEKAEDALEKKKEALEKTEEELEKAENAAREAENAAREAENAAREAENAVKEMIFEAIEEIGELPEAVCERVREENNINILKSMHKIALKAESIKQFEEQIANL